MNSSVLRLAVALEHACAIFSSNIQCVGGNSYGQLGIGNNYASLTPVTIQLPINPETSARMTPVQVVTGAFHTCILVDEKDRGSVYCVGRNVDNQLGNDNNSDSNELVQVNGMDDTYLTNVKQTVAGCHHTCAIFQDDNAPLFCWGRNTEYQLGFNKEALRKESKDVKLMALSRYTTCIVTTSNVVECTTADKSTGGTFTVDFGDDEITKLTAGNNHFCALLKGNNAKCFGSNYFGQLGNGSRKYNDWITIPQSVVSHDESSLFEITDINAGGDSTCLVSDGKPICFGENSDYQLGIDSRETGDIFPVLTPTPFGCDV
ncbi:hypothetical protein CTEN210_00801 [Chaetoceros tenuissimus]|uniref:Uncharacterized protein n=1 Tax=Chaetoceros tenuissimus TaxID=426638 RepID=A0AAD3GYR5_9STRA|nr:hypothetical protein CTEN210_00801 [Chaetoceros tenuissimus]